MGSVNILGALAIGTLGIVLVALLWHAISLLRHPSNRFHFHNIFIRDGKAAATSTAEDAEPGTQLAKPLSVRLNESIDSQHEVDPSSASTQVQRTSTFNRERAAAATNT